MRKIFAAFTVLAALAISAYAAEVELTNVSYDPTRELYEEFNKAFAKHYKAETGDNVTIKVSHGGSSKQALKVIEGLEADVVTLALAFDIENIASKSQLLRDDWQKQLPYNSTPYSSTVVFLVRKGNPKNLKNWDDLVKDGVKIIAANPKTSGVARWSYLAGWGYILKKELGDLKKLNDPQYADEVAKAQKKAKEYTKEIYKRVIVLDSGARGASQTFIQRGQGDVLLNWENEAYKAVHDQGGEDKFEIVVPPVSILAEPPVAIVDKVVDKRKTRKVAEAYLKYLYSDEGQEIAAKNSYRPRNKDILEKYKNNFVTNVELFNIDDVFGGWQKAQKAHFSDGGVFDEIYAR
ncbi:MAG: sulfate ABC transporter substrate-binding protein [Planctomycetaceae bacterium]|jgi:sulfate transport system substrate-binding protein|nr:sulfate ABC transporter substrate-binding protein [Planctomycetaceae bacterium]